MSVILTYSNPEPVPFFNKIYEFRYMLSLSQSELAYSLGISPSLLSLIETGKRIPSSTLVNRFLNFFHCSFYDLFIPPDISLDHPAAQSFWWHGSL